MKRRSSLPLLLLAPWASALAQPVLDNGSATLIPGDQYTYSHGDYPAPGPGGANQVWDYSSLPLGSSNAVSYVAPSSTGLASTFPNATVAQDAGSGDYLFYRGTATSYEEDGFSVGGATGVCADRLVLIQYPMSYNTTFTDDQVCTVTQGNSWSRTSTVTVTADGYGSVTTANGTITNVLRLHSVQHMIDNQYNPASIYDNDRYYYMKPGVHAPVVALDHAVIDLFGIILSDSSLSVMDGNSIGIEEALRHDIGVDVMPNPATDRVEVIFGVDAGLTLSIDLIDLTGRTLLSMDHRTQVAGVQRTFIDMQHVPAGAYLVRVTDAQGNVGMKRLVKR